MESELADNDEQYRASRFDLISRLADDLAHEIKNPLNAIIINLEVMKVRVSRGDTAAALDRAAVIEQETRRLHALVDRVLQLLRPSRDESENVALDQVLDEVLPLFEAQMKLARHEFHCDGDTAAVVAIGRDRLKFALLSLLTTLHDQLEPGSGSVRLRCSVLEDVVHLAANAAANGETIDVAGPAMAQAAVMIRRLLESVNGTLRVSGGDATIVLPRGTMAL